MCEIKPVCPTHAVLLATVTLAPLLVWACPSGSQARGTMAKLLKELLGVVVASTGLATLLQARAVYFSCTILQYISSSMFLVQYISVQYISVRQLFQLAARRLDTAARF